MVPSREAFLNLVGGRQTPARSVATLESVDPATGTTWATIPRGGAADIDDAVHAATQAFDGWWGLPAFQRSAHLRALAEIMARHSRELAEVESRDNGRPVAETIAGDLPACVQMFHFHAGAADKIHGDTVNVGSTSFNFTRREPIGVIGIIIPWNSPLSLVSAKAGAALAAGNRWSSSRPSRRRAPCCVGAHCSRKQGSRPESSTSSPGWARKPATPWCVIPASQGSRSRARPVPAG
jgi:acyl-CoA reductase-like NAD-dependent aldehyde dehydrogenase